MSTEGSWFKVYILGVGVQCSGFRVQGSGFRVQSAECRVQNAGCRVQVLGTKTLGVLHHAGGTDPLGPCGCPTVGFWAPTPGPSNPIPGSFLEPSGPSWSHFVSIYRQKLSKPSKIDCWLRFEGPGVGTHLASSIVMGAGTWRPP